MKREFDLGSTAGVCYKGWSNLFWKVCSGADCGGGITSATVGNADTTPASANPSVTLADTTPASANPSVTPAAPSADSWVRLERFPPGNCDGPPDSTDEYVVSIAAI